ncbi:kinesin-related protein 12 isoform X3 [Achroia grisella]|uniref:kinesin-related protein 12 isoform X3 n=1 Tax=Achroia grisella TaxID=688607 RepID=UPI0027D1F24C|nr:kinesin-related protein 12 isoform X3 [Achroia grisella]
MDSFESLNMRSIWTRMSGFDEDIWADAAQSQVTGGGEGAPVVTDEAKQPEQPVLEQQGEVKKEEQVAEAPKPEGVPSSEPAKPEAVVSEQITKEVVAPVLPVEEPKKEETVPAQEPVEEAKAEQKLPPADNVREEEIDLLKARVRNLETELQAALSKPSGKNHEMIEKIKQQHEELLSKARGMIFDKTKMVKNQELQIEALTTQVQSLKDINLITKDLLEIRNSEIKAMEDRLQAMEARFKAEKDRYGLVLQRAQTSSNINDDLRKEYETQLVIFKELREKYELRVQALVAENTRLKESAKGSTS